MNRIVTYSAQRTADVVSFPEAAINKNARLYAGRTTDTEKILKEVTS
ncbi:hypothetical protein [Streptomyces xiamenensis]